MGTTHLGALAPLDAPWWVLPTWWAPSLTSSSHTTPFTQKKITIALSRVLAPEMAVFDLFARISVSEIVSGNCCLVCDSFVQLVLF